MLCPKGGWNAKRLVALIETGEDRQIPGIGVLKATCLVATVGNAGQFYNGRHLAAFLGLVPKPWSSGGKTTLRGISKRGDKYLRRLLIHGARFLCKPNIL